MKYVIIFILTLLFCINNVNALYIANRNPTSSYSLPNLFDQSISTYVKIYGVPYYFNFSINKTTYFNNTDYFYINAPASTGWSGYNYTINKHCIYNSNTLQDKLKIILYGTYTGTWGCMQTIIACYNHNASTYTTILDMGYRCFGYYQPNHDEIYEMASFLDYTPEYIIHNVTLYLNGSNINLNGTYKYVVNFTCESNSSKYIYQENSNSTTILPSDSGWESGHNGSMLIDGDWTTYASDSPTGGIYGELKINYSVPIGIKGAIWQVKDGAGITNLTLSPTCWNQTTITFNVRTQENGGTSFTDWLCGFTSLRQITGPGNHYAYEEGIFWEYNDTLGTYINSTSINNKETHDLSAKYWNFSCNNSGGIQRSLFLNISKATPSVNLAFNTSPIIYIGNSINVSCTEYNGLTAIISKNGTNTTNPYITTPTLGDYLYTCTNYGNENYTTSTTNTKLSVISIETYSGTGFVGLLAIPIALGLASIIIANSNRKKR